MNGPNPVCTLATKKLSQSRPRGRSGPGPHPGCLGDAATGRGVGRRRVAGGPTIVGGLAAVGVVRRGAHLLVRQVDRHALVGGARRRHVHRRPAHRDPARSDAHEAADIDHDRARLARRVDHHVDDAADLPAVGITHHAAQHAGRVRLVCSSGAGAAAASTSRASPATPSTRPIPGPSATDHCACIPDPASRVGGQDPTQRDAHDA